MAKTPKIKRQMLFEMMVERAAAVLWCHSKWNGDHYTTKSMARAMMEAALKRK